MLGEAQGKVRFLRKCTSFPSFGASGMVYIKLGYTALHTAMDRCSQTWAPACPALTDVNPFVTIVALQQESQFVQKNAISVRADYAYWPAQVERESMKMKRRTGGNLATAIINFNENNVSLAKMKLDLTISNIRVIYIHDYEVEAVEMDK